MLISVVTVCLNDLDGLTKTRDSLFEYQEMAEHIQWIVIDGGSTDGTVKFLENCRDRVTYLSESDEGLYDAMNKGIELSDGTFVIFINAGDQLLLTRSIIEFLEANQTATVFCDARVTYPLGSRTRRANSVSYIKHSNPTVHQAVFFARCDLQRFRYRLTFEICGDYALLCDMYRAGTKFEILHQSCCNFFVGGISTIKFGQLMREAYSIQRDILGLPLIFRLASLLKRALSVLATYLYFKYSYFVQGYLMADRP